jgi:hypothetical protein
MITVPGNVRVWLATGHVEIEDEETWLLARLTKDGRPARRLLALAAIYDGRRAAGGEDRRRRASDHPGLGAAVAKRTRPFNRGRGPSH